jgi:UTP:GlnB (protein PII) uridylyltransferase
LVEAPDSEGLLHGITSALFAQGVRILSCEIGTHAGVARDRFEIASVTGEPLSSVDLCDIQLAVLDSLPRERDDLL